MFNSAILDVAVGVVFVFILVSTLCSAIREGIEAWLKTRASYLECALRGLFQDGNGSGLTKAFFEHPLIYALYLGKYQPRDKAEPPVWNVGSKLPSYIPSSSFSRALLDIVARGPSTDAASGHPDFAEPTLTSLRASVQNLQNPPVQRVLLSAIDAAEGDVEAVRQELEAWYDAAMERVSGWYKRTTQWILFLVALVVVGSLNVNTLTLVDHLYRDQALRASLVAAAESSPGGMDYQAASKQLGELRLPLGWGAKSASAEESADTQEFEPWRDALQPILGLLITAIAATMGAPFWFDVLNKVSVVRAAIKPAPKPAPEKREPEPTSESAAGKSHRGSPAPAPVSPIPELAAGRMSVPIVEHGHELDACDLPIEEPTPDEELPEARGGVATEGT